MPRRPQPFSSGNSLDNFRNRVAALFSKRKHRRLKARASVCMAAESVESRLLLTPVLALNPVAGLEGNLTNFDGQIAGVTPGNSYTIDVNWGDGSATQQIAGVAVGNGLDKFTVSHNYADDGMYPISATISESPLIVGADAVFVIDVSGSTSGVFAGNPIGDLNHDKKPNTILDAEIASFIALNQDLINRGLGDISNVSIVAFSSTASTLDLDPVAPGVQISTTPLADCDANGVLDVDQALQNLVPVLQTNFEAALQETINDVMQLGTQPGQGNVVFLSDGVSQTTTFLDEVQILRFGLGQNIRAFGVGAGASLPQLLAIDPTASIFTNTQQLLDTFSGAGVNGGGSSQSSIMANVSNAGPQITSATVTSAMANDGTAELVVDFSDSGLLDVHTVHVNWGDGTSEELPATPGARSLVATHTYVFTEVVGGTADIAVSVSDETLTSQPVSLQTAVYDPSPVRVEFYLGSSQTLESDLNATPRLLVNGVVTTPQTVTVTAVDGTATVADGDFTNVATVVIPIGIYDGTLATSVPVNLTINNDSRAEANESLSLWLSTTSVDAVPGVNGGGKVWRLAGEKCSARFVEGPRGSVVGGSRRGVNEAFRALC